MPPAIVHVVISFAAAMVKEGISTSTIFVCIPAYRHPGTTLVSACPCPLMAGLILTECQHTIRDLFAKAAFPKRIRVGVCFQFHATLDSDCFAHWPTDADYSNQVLPLS